MVKERTGSRSRTGAITRTIGRDGITNNHPHAIGAHGITAYPASQDSRIDVVWMGRQQRRLTGFTAYVTD
jgi:hypothetical protein